MVEFGKGGIGERVVRKGGGGEGEGGGPDGELLENDGGDRGRSIGDEGGTEVVDFPVDQTRRKRRMFFRRVDGGAGLFLVLQISYSELPKLLRELFQSSLLHPEINSELGDLSVPCRPMRFEFVV